MSQKLKVVTIGGGSSYTPELLEGFIAVITNCRSANYGWWMSKVVKLNWILFLISANG